MVSGRAARKPGDFRNALRLGLALAIPSALVQAEEGAHSYPEWDCASSLYRPGWTRVEEVAPSADEPRFDPATLNALGNRALQRALATLCLGFRRHTGQVQGDHLVLDPMIRLAVDLRSGHSGDERIYAASLRTRRDLGVLILLDTSSSTLEANGTERDFDLQVRAAWNLCRTFDLLGDRVAMYGFHSWGRTPVRRRVCDPGHAQGAGGSGRARCRLRVPERRQRRRRRAPRACLRLGQLPRDRRHPADGEPTRMSMCLAGRDEGKAELILTMITESGRRIVSGRAAVAL